MNDANTGKSSKRLRFDFMLPCPLWIGLAAFVMFGLALGWWFIEPYYRQRLAVREIERSGGTVDMWTVQADWLLKFVPYEWLEFFKFTGVVFLRDTCITDADLACLKWLKNPQDLVLGNTQITDEGLVHLKDLTSLETLELTGTQVTDAGLAHISGLTQVTDLSLGKTKVTGSGFVHLKQWAKLKKLWLTDSSVTDTGLQHLSGLKSLQFLDLLDAPNVTDEGIEQLKLALPSLKVQQGSIARMFETTTPPGSYESYELLLREYEPGDR